MKLTVAQQIYYASVFYQAAVMIAERKETFSCFAVTRANNPSLSDEGVVAAYRSDPALQLYKDLIDPNNAEGYIPAGQGRVYYHWFDVDTPRPTPRTRGHRVMALLACYEYLRHADPDEELF